MIRGVDVTLYERTPGSTADEFGAAVFTETAVTVHNVLISPAAQEDIVNDLQLFGSRAVYELCIPKGDTHDWCDCRVSFFGSDFHVYGPVVEYIEANVPLKWNRKVRVERYE